MVPSDIDTAAATAEEERHQHKATAKVEADRVAALDAYEAKHVAVHTQALIVVNIKVLIPVMLDCTANN